MLQVHTQKDTQKINLIRNQQFHKYRSNTKIIELYYKVLNNDAR